MKLKRAVEIVGMISVYMTFMSGCISVNVALSGAGGSSDFGEEVNTHWLKITYHPSVPVNVSEIEAEVDTILNEANEIAQNIDPVKEGIKPDRLGDFACDITLLRDGDIDTFDVPSLDGTINTLEDFNDVVGTPEFQGVRMIADFTWCGENEALGDTWPGILACTKYPTTMVIARPIYGGALVQDVEGNIWLHEFGHKQGLYVNGVHSQDEYAVMNAYIDVHRRWIDEYECAIYRTPQ